MAEPRILVVRRENIGDLVCTTPLLRALRRQLPAARICVLATRYNRAVLENNPDIDALYSYTKAKHRFPGESLAGIYFDRLRLLWRLRRERFDWALLPGGPHPSALRFARWAAPRRTLVRGPEAAAAGEHEVEQSCHLLTAMGLSYEAPAPCVVADAQRVSRLRERLAATLGSAPRAVVGLHISARRPAQRWPAAHFAALARSLVERHGVAVALMWAPGAADDPAHPGDDGKAAEVAAACRDLPLVQVPTTTLPDLVAALALCDRVVCADGGAMHLAAGLGKPLVCLFGDSPVARWRPWGVRHELLQRDPVAGIAPAEVAAAYGRLDNPAVEVS